MKILRFCLLLLLIGCLWFNGCSKKQDKLYVINTIGLREIPFDMYWLFLRDNPPGAEKPEFVESDWRMLDVPHDWSIEDLPTTTDKKQIGPFSEESPGQASAGHVVGGTAWYRKHFRLDADSTKIVTIHFDGVYMDSDIWLNGHHLGKHPYGYTPFGFELTPYLNRPEADNVLAVQVKNEGQNSRWYSGSGIYRHVWLTVTEPVHVQKWGVVITTPEITEQSATVRVKTTVQNRTGKEVELIINTSLEYNAQAVTSETQAPLKIAANSYTDVEQELTVAAPQLWSPENPNLYTADIKIIQAEKEIDRVSQTFGIRSIHFDAAAGFTLNGQPVLLRGGCVHHDNGPLGSATIDRAEERRVERMKAFGFNAIRTSHNPPSKQFLDACDRLGMLVIDEAFDMWQREKNPQDYHRFFDDYWRKDLAAMVLRDRNHPSVIMWSIGNEINERADPSGLQLTREMKALVHELDPTRPVTAAICEFWDHRGRPWEATAPAFALLDVGGYNYQWQRYESDHAKYPDRLMAGTESVALQAFENWQQVEKHPWVIGDFVWTGMDYLGESGIGNSILYKDSTNVGFWRDWPWFNAYCGDIDICGFKKPQSYFRDVVWHISPLEMAVHAPIPQGYKERVSFWGWPDEQQSWTWAGHEGDSLQVSVYSRCEQVVLELNGQKIGERPVSAATGLKASFSVPYQPGVLKAIGITGGKEVAAKTFTTTGAPVKLRLTVDRNPITGSRNDLAYITVEAVDAQGRPAPDAELPVQFTVSGNGELAAVGNGKPDDMRSFKTPECTLFHGRCLVIVRPNGQAGKIKLQAKAENVKTAELIIRTK
ncbi:MAG TPA: glycoside hydrolase family 2 TIM barrel-domain containing protein [bacterium]|nr:glycoside hydrolase family 2 TIM barrel-domain containing protein [bacterium]HPN46226.1 glycoside hydrolase family 2 TIM barrel-domain containing protein [bacterium]